MPFHFSFSFFQNLGKVSVQISLNTKRFVYNSSRAWPNEESIIQQNSHNRLTKNISSALIKEVNEQLDKKSFDIKKLQNIVRLHCDQAYSMIALVDTFLIKKKRAVQAKRIKQRSYLLYVHQIKKFKSFLSEFELTDLQAEDLTQRHLEDFFLYLYRQNNIKRNTAMTYATQMVNIMNFAQRSGWIYEHNLKWISRPRLPSDIRFINETELKILETYNPLDENLRFVQRLFIIMSRTGMDFSTMQSILLKDFHRTYIVIRREKRQSIRVPISGETSNLIQKCKQDNGIHLFRSVRLNWFNIKLGKLCSAARLKKSITSTSAKLTFAYTNAFPKNVSLETVSAVLGHSRTQYTDSALNYVDVKTIAEMGAINFKI